MSFTLIKKPFYGLPILHFNMECASEVVRTAHELKPDAIAVELPEPIQDLFIQAAARLPDLSIVKVIKKIITQNQYYLSEPCEPLFEAIRYGLENKIPVFCIDLDIESYPSFSDELPDSYAISKIGYKKYMEACLNNLPASMETPTPFDSERELYMAKRLKELSFSFDRILFVSGLSHIKRVLELTDQTAFKKQTHSFRQGFELLTLSEDSQREVMGECGYVTLAYELWRDQFLKESTKVQIPDRQKIYLSLLKQASDKYLESQGITLSPYALRNTLKFMRNYAHLKNKLLPNLFELLAACKGCVDHNFAYETWLLATTYPFLRNVDALPEIKLSTEEIWGGSKKIYFHRKLKNPKSTQFAKRKKDTPNIRFDPPNHFSICSYPPEDSVIENFGKFLKKKGVQILSEDSSKVIPFSTSLEDGIDTKETIRHFFEKKLYVKKFGKPSGDVGSVVFIFDEDTSSNEIEEKYPWKTTWIGEHSQESDMAFYATDLRNKVVGPGISRCEYGGFMMSYPPRRLFDVWHDSDYAELKSKSEVLLVAAIDYSLKSLITYVAKKPPRSFIKSYASRYGKKVVYIPLGQVSPNLINRIRIFHVLDGHDKRKIAGDYIY